MIKLYGMMLKAASSPRRHNVKSDGGFHMIDVHLGGLGHKPFLKPFVWMPLYDGVR